jgi:hypothetical protein
VLANERRLSTRKRPRRGWNIPPMWQVTHSNRSKCEKPFRVACATPTP